MNRYLLDEIKQQIANAWSEREQIKGDLENNKISFRKGMILLESIDINMSKLDTQFKSLWDEQHKK